MTALGRCLRRPVISSVRGLIITGFALLVIVLVLVVAGSAWRHRQHQATMTDMERHDATAQLFHNAALDMDFTDHLLNEYITSGDDTIVPEIRSRMAAAAERLAEARAQEEMRGDKEEAAIIDEIMSGLAFLSETAEQVVALRQSGDVQGATVALDAAMPRIHQLGLAVTRAADFENLEVAADRSRAIRTGDLTFWLLIVSGTVGATFGLAASVFIARSILRPLSSLESAALAVAGGDLEARAPATGPRELAHLGASLNQMTESLLDASRRRELEEALRQSEERARLIVDTASDAFISIDVRSVITAWNRAAESIFGWSRDEALGRPLGETIIPPQLRDGHENGLKRFLVTGEGPVLNKRTEITAIHRDGHEFPVELAVWAVGSGDTWTLNAFVHDISERKRAEEAVREAEEKYRTLVEQANDHIIILQEGKTVYRNPSYAELLGYTAAESADRSFLDFVAPEDKARVRDYYRKRLRGEPVPDQYEVRILTEGGRRVTMEVKPRVIQYKGQPATMVILRDITERKKAEAQLRRLNQQLEKEQEEIEALNRSLETKVRQRTEELRLANEELRQRNRQLLDARAQAATDALTGLSNHRAFHERIREEVRRAQESNSPVGLIMLDIDGFKRVNDSRGHLAGDEILRALANTITSVAPRKDSYRYGGDEFAVMLPGVEPRTTAGVAERLRRAVEKRLDGSGQTVTVSLGVASFPATASSAEELIYGADAAMYWAKSAGKNRVGDWSKIVQPSSTETPPWYLTDRGVKAPDVVAALVAALAAKDPVTAAHTERCSWYTGKLAEELGLAEEETSVVRLASLLHDIGKLAVPDEVLSKPGPLNEEEWAQMKQHSAAALRVLGHIRSVADATPAILHHHEHFDGSGYPDGIDGDQIPIASRILLVTDAFDAMTTDRPYRKAMPVEAAIDELKRHSGTQFDPTVVEAFLRILSRQGAEPLARVKRGRDKAVEAEPRQHQRSDASPFATGRSRR